MAHDVFISYSSKDKLVADGICVNLEAAGVRCWIAPRDIAPGEDWPTAIANAIPQCRVMVLVFSANSNASEDVGRELILAARNKLVIIPFKIENIEPEPGKDYYLARTHWLDAMNPPTQEQIRALLICVKALLPARETPPARYVQPPTPPRNDQPTAGNEPQQPAGLRPAPKGRPKWLRYLWIPASFLRLGLISWAVLPFVRQSFPGLTLAQVTAAETATATGLTPIPTASFTPAAGIGPTRVSAIEDMKLIYVPEGNFSMGSEAFINEQPVHTVNLDAFWIYQTEVTNGIYALCVQAGKCTPPIENRSDTRSEYYDDAQYANYPVIFVNWNQARAYCSWANARLPTEAEWEKAARGTDARTYPWGNDAPTCSLVNFDGGSGCVADTSAVGSYPSGASPYGALDMAGNVWEWVNDWYSETYYSQSSSSNPQGPSLGDFRVLRGGSWFNIEDDVRTSSRIMYNPSDSYLTIGFRCTSSAP